MLFSVVPELSENTWRNTTKDLYSPLLPSLKRTSPFALHITSSCTAEYSTHWNTSYSKRLVWPVQPTHNSRSNDHIVWSWHKLHLLWQHLSNNSHVIHLLFSYFLLHVVLTLGSPSLAASRPWTPSGQSLLSAFCQAHRPKWHFPFLTKFYIISPHFSKFPPPCCYGFILYHFWHRLLPHHPASLIRKETLHRCLEPWFIQPYLLTETIQSMPIYGPIAYISLNISAPCRMQTNRVHKRHLKQAVVPLDLIICSV